jgi:hypothetical protein
LIAWLILTAAPLLVIGAETDPRRGLAQAVTVDWSGVPLRQALAGMSRSAGLPLVIDRRVDPTLSVELVARDLPVERLLLRLGNEHNFATSVVGPVVYLGPHRSAESIRTLIALAKEQVQPLSSKTRTALLSPKAMQWDDLTTPRGLIAQMAAEAGATIDGIERVPHDLWAANEFPPLQLIERLQLILSQFDLTFRITSGGKTIAIVSVPEQVEIVRSYPGGSDPEALAKSWARKIPGATLEVHERKIVVRGRLEDHEQLQQPSTVSKKASPAKGGKQVHTLKVDNIPLGRLLKSLADTLGLELKLDEEAVIAAGISLDQLVSIDAKEVTTLELFERLAGPAGLNVKIDGTSIVVTPKR